MEAFLRLFNYILILNMMACTALAAEVAGPSSEDARNLRGSEATPAVNIEQQLRNNLKVEKYKLANGLTVVLHKDATIPMVSYHLWYRVGSKDEKPGRTGLAHFFEHLMFKGSQKFSAKDYEEFVTGNGGYNNAFTSRDYTGYYTLIPSDQLKKIIEIEADRMENLNFKIEEINSEREVVKEERRYRYENNPDGALYELLYHTVFKVSSYHWPVIGYMKDLNAATLEEFKAFYKSYYSPNNAVIVVAGDFKSNEVKSWIEKNYGSLKPSDIPARNKVKEPQQKSARTAGLKMDLQAPKLVIAYPAPDAYSDDEPALQLLSSVLTGGPSSRLYKKLVRDKAIVTSVSADMSAGILEGVFDITADLRPKRSVNQVKQLIVQELNALKAKPISQAEMLKVKNQVMLGYTQALTTVAGKARILAYSEVVYSDPIHFFKDLDAYQKVTPEDIQRVAKKYFPDNKQSFLTVLPK